MLGEKDGISASAVIVGLIEAASRHPLKVAITDESQSLNFSELLNRVKILAGVVNQKRSTLNLSNIQPILVDRSVESVVAVLSCIYAGIGFTPIDGDIPMERILMLLSRIDTEELILVAPKFNNLKFPSSVVSISTITHGEPLNDPIPVNLEETALVIFTSGSTGKPKGVEFDWMLFAPKVLQARQYPSEEIPTMRIAVNQPIYFSSGLCQVLTVCRGIPIFILDPTRLTPLQLLMQSREWGITNFTAPPSVLRNLSQVPPDIQVLLPSVRIIETGAEGIRYEDLYALRRFFNNDVLVGHGLGATEGSSKIRNIFTLSQAPTNGQVPVGVETEPGGQIWLLTPKDGSTNIYEVAFGARLAKGYFKDPDLTKERFIFDEQGKRWWRSGDLVLRDEDGVFWHRGRVDDLVKIRGKLASPSEATQVLLAFPEVKAAVVLPHEIGGALRLVAHIVLREEGELTARNARRALALQLPSHLIPSYLVRHQVLPINSRGKIDRVALQTAPIVSWRDERIVHPLTASEFSVLSEAMLVLDLPELSVTDDLWEFGLDSLTAIELISRLEGSAKRNLAIDDLLMNRTVEQIAKILRRSFIPHFDNLLLNEGGSLPMLFAIPGIGGHATHFVHLAKALGQDQPLMVFPDIFFDSRNLSIEEESQRIADSISNVQPDGPIALTGYSGGGVLTVEVARKLQSEGRFTYLMLLDAGVRHIPSSKTGNQEVASSKTTLPKRGMPFLDRFTGFSSLLRTLGIRRSIVEIRYAIKHKYLGLRYLSILYFLTGGRYPRGIARYNYLALRKARMRKGFIVQPLECSATYFEVEGNSKASEWHKIISTVSFVKVGGDHRTMLQPPHVADLARQIRELLGSNKI